MSKGLLRIPVHLAAFIAVAALAFQIAVPSGLMLANANGRAELVICTGHGPLLAHAGDAGAPAKMPKPSQGGVCAFAGHATLGPLSFAPPLGPARVAYAEQLPRTNAGAWPGLGLAAPPPPSRGPPTLST